MNEYCPIKRYILCNDLGIWNHLDSTKVSTIVVVESPLRVYDEGNTFILFCHRKSEQDPAGMLSKNQCVDPIEDYNNHIDDSDACVYPIQR